MTTQKTFLAALGLAALLSSSLALADHDHKGHKHGGPRQDVVALEQSKISAAQAIAIAEKDTNATADNLDLELHRGSAVYEIDLHDDKQEYEIRVDAITGEITNHGEICMRIDPRPVGLTPGYFGDPEKNAETFRDGFYHSGDIAEQDEEGYITYIGRGDDVFKASDYRLSPFELESAVIEHEAVAEVAVVPSPDPIRLAVPKAYVVLAAGFEPTAETAEAILKHCRETLAPYKRIRRLEFHDLPKTVSGKIRRVDLRKREIEIHANDPEAAKVGAEFCEADFPSLKG